MSPTAAKDLALDFSSPIWVYDEIMRSIEPELMTSQINDLEKKYVDETPEDRAVRMERYELAFQVYQDTLEDLAREMEADAHLWEAQIKLSMAADAVRGDAKKMQSIEDQLSANHGA